MEFQYYTTEEDIRQFMKKENGRENLKATISTTVVIGGGFLILFHGDFSAPIVACIAGGYFVLMFFFLKLKVAITTNRLIKNMGESYFEHPIALSLEDKGLYIKSVKTESLMPYDTIEGVTENEEFVSVKLGKEKLLCIPVREFKDPAVKEELLSSLRERIPVMPSKKKRK